MLFNVHEYRSHAMKERRRSPRKRVRIKAEIISEGISCSGFIENVSERGIGLEADATNLLGGTTRFSPGTKYQIRFETPSGDLLILNCKVTWSFRTGTHGVIRKVGLEVIFPPPGYIDFCCNP